MRSTIVTSILVFTTLYFFTKKTANLPINVIDSGNNNNGGVYDPSNLKVKYIRVAERGYTGSSTDYRFKIEFEILNDTGQDYLIENNTDITLTKITTYNKRKERLHVEHRNDILSIPNGRKSKVLHTEGQYRINANLSNYIEITEDKMIFILELNHKGKPYTTTISL